MIALLRFLLVGIIVLMATQTFAENKSNKIELSYKKKSGNTESESGYGLLSYKSKRNSHEYNLYGKASYLKGYGRSYMTEGTGKRYYRPFFVSLLAGWERDVNAGYRHKYYTGPGIGIELLRSRLIGAATLLYGEDYYTDDTQIIHRSLRLDGFYTTKILDSLIFSQQLRYTRHLDTPVTHVFISKTQIETGDKISLGVAYIYKRQSTPALFKKKEDRELVATASYKF